MKTEVCGVLIGHEEGSTTVVEACIAGANAAQGGAHVTFTQDTWEHIYEIKDHDYPNERIVGWYHSHPGFGIFLSEHDLFIHQNFFSSPQQIAWVYDPHSDEEGCFGWRDGSIERIDDVSFRFTLAKNESAQPQVAESEEVVVRVKKDEEVGGWRPYVMQIAISLLFFTLGVVATFYYVQTRVYILPKDTIGMFLVDDQGVHMFPPDVTAEILRAMQAASEQMRMSPPSVPMVQQPKASESQTQPKGPTDGRK